METQRDTIVWEAPPDPIVLGPGELHLWRARVPAGDSMPFWHLLSSDEKIRTKRFMFEPDRREFSFGRGLLRNLLSAYGAGSPESLILEYKTHGKPFLPQGISFNISHSKGVTLFAFAARGDLGIDVERVQNKSEGEKLVQRYFSQAEIEFYRRHPVEERQQTFFKLWTLKESFIKAKGKGMAYGLDEFSVQWNEQGHLALTLPEDEARQDWTLRLFQTYPGYQGACVISGKIGVCKFWDGDEWAQNILHGVENL